MIKALPFVIRVGMSVLYVVFCVLIVKMIVVGTTNITIAGTVMTIQRIITRILGFGAITSLSTSYSFICSKLNGRWIHTLL